MFMRQGDYKHTQHSDVGSIVTARQVMVKGVGGLPRVLYFEAVSKTHAALKPLPGKYLRPLWFPKSMLFQYDPALMEQLKVAHGQREVEKIKTLWSRIRAFDATPDERTV